MKVGDAGEREPLAPAYGLLKGHPIRTKILLAAFALATATSAHEEEARLDVPIMIAGQIGKDACPTQGRVTDLADQPDGVIPVRRGPGENEPFRKIDRLRGAQPVLVCEHLGGWSGIVYGADTTSCRTYAVLPVSREYTSSCQWGWVLSRFIGAGAE